MQEIALEDQIRNKLTIQEHANIQQGQPRKARNKIKKTPKQPVEDASNISIGESLKSEIEMIPHPTKTPISILQELLSRRGISMKNLRRKSII